MALLVLESEECRPQLVLCMLQSQLVLRMLQPWFVLRMLQPWLVLQMLQPRLVLCILQSELCSLCFCSKCSQPLSHCSSLGVHS